MTSMGNCSMGIDELAPPNVISPGSLAGALPLAEALDVSIHERLETQVHVHQVA